LILKQREEKKKNPQATPHASPMYAATNTFSMPWSPRRRLGKPWAAMASRKKSRRWQTSFVVGTDTSDKPRFAIDNAVDDDLEVNKT
jgi:hypothetical protein